ncbi:PPOX class F420-dependent enzyme [Halobacteriales archaeon QS_1_68_17]|nr:MAG: PPOX class F420-dependent enzyme [Halobacteriales archaeon QS_1_68_17]
MPSIPEEYHDLFERSTIAHFASVLPDGTPHVTPVWIGYDAGADRLLINTEDGRRKTRNVRANPSVGISMTDPDDPYRRLSVLGTVEEFREEGAREHIDELARRYIGEDYPNEVETERVILVVRPDRVF